jgi:hypothetical protein
MKLWLRAGGNIRLAGRNHLLVFRCVARVKQRNQFLLPMRGDPIQDRLHIGVSAPIARAGPEAAPQRELGRPKPVLRPRMAREADQRTPQILPLKSTLPLPLTPNTLLGSAQRMNGPAASSSPEADANLPVPFTIFAVAL